MLMPWSAVFGFWLIATALLSLILYAPLRELGFSMKKVVAVIAILVGLLVVGYKQYDDSQRVVELHNIGVI